MKNKLANAILIALIGFPVIVQRKSLSLKRSVPNNKYCRSGVSAYRCRQPCTFVSMLQTPLKWKSAFRGEMTKEADGWWSLVSKGPEVVGVPPLSKS